MRWSLLIQRSFAKNRGTEDAGGVVWRLFWRVGHLFWVWILPWTWAWCLGLGLGLDWCLSLSSGWNKTGTLLGLEQNGTGWCQCQAGNTWKELDDTRGPRQTHQKAVRLFFQTVFLHLISQYPLSMWSGGISQFWIPPSKWRRHLPLILTETW